MHDDNGLENLADTLRERRATHGEFEDYAVVVQLIKAALVMGDAYLRLTPVQVEALHMISHKMARSVQGDAADKDTWADIAGYAMCVHAVLCKSEQTEIDREKT